MTVFMRQLVSRGYENITFDSLAEEAGLSKAHVYHFFKSSDELLLKCVQLIAAGGELVSRERVAAAKTGAEKILAVSDAAFDWYSKNPAYLSVLILALYKGTFDRRYHSILEEIRTRGVQHMESLLANYGTSERDLAAQIQSAIVGHLVVSRARGVPEQFEVFRNLSRQTVARLIATGNQETSRQPKP